MYHLAIPLIRADIIGKMHAYQSFFISYKLQVTIVLHCYYDKIPD